MNFAVKKSLARFAFALVVCILSTGLTLGQNSIERPFERGEELFYEGEVSRSLLRSIDVADFKFTATRVPIAESQGNGNGSKHSLQFIGEVKSKGFFTKLFNLNFLERMTSIVEPRSFSVKTTKRYDQQGKRVRSSETIYDKEEGKLTWTEHDLKDPSREPRVASSPFTGEVQDVLSAIYFVRKQKLDPGSTFEMTVSDSGKVFQVPVKVLEQNRLKTVVGKVDTVRLEIGLFGPGKLVQTEGQFSLWLTADDRRIPVRGKIKTDYGTFEIRLKKVLQTRTNLASTAPK
jgi:Protein of unknown function (DUF3108)